MKHDFYISHHGDDWACICGTLLDPTKTNYKPFIQPAELPVIKDGKFIQLTANYTPLFINMIECQN
jgi:hypothetical protein